MASQTSFDRLPHSIRAVFDAYERDGTRLVRERTIYLCMVREIVEGEYLKMKRPRSKALAPGKVRNETAEDVRAGQQKWDGIYESMKDAGYDYCQPISFIIQKSNKKRKLHQGHHRVTIAEELGIEIISVAFTFQ
jgi:hypothetical protein